MVGHMQNSNATFYTSVITVVILWPHYKVEHLPHICSNLHVSAPQIPPAGLVN